MAPDDSQVIQEATGLTVNTRRNSNTQDNMLLDARGHLKLTDLGLCKKVGEVSLADEPEAILEMMRRQTISGESLKDGVPTNASASPSNKHRKSDDAMAMSIDEMPGVKRDGKTRREVCVCVCVLYYVIST
jgi:serine/threonine protein kinase